MCKILSEDAIKTRRLSQQTALESQGELGSSYMEYMLLKLRYSFTLLTLFASLFYVQQGVAMSLFFGGKEVEAVLISPLQGRITFDGKPASHAKINLWIKWKDQQGETFTYKADENGFFSIPKQTATYRESALAQIVITQEINVEYNNETYLIWTLSKTNTHEFGELGGTPSNMICELTNDMVTIRGGGSLGGMACAWDSLDK